MHRILCNCSFVLIFFILSCKEKQTQKITYQNISVKEQPVQDPTNKLLTQRKAISTSLFSKKDWQGEKTDFVLQRQKRRDAKQNMNTVKVLKPLKIKKTNFAKTNSIDFSQQYYDARDALYKQNNPKKALGLLRILTIKNSKRQLLKKSNNVAHLDEAESLRKIGLRQKNTDKRYKTFSSALGIYNFFIQKVRTKDVENTKLFSNAYYNRALVLEEIYKIKSTSSNKLLLNRAWNDFLFKSNKSFEATLDQKNFAKYRIQALGKGAIKTFNL